MAAVNGSKVALRSGIELTPDLALIGIHKLQPTFHGCFVQTGRVGDQDDLSPRQSLGSFDVSHHSDTLGKVVHQCRFTLAAEGEILDLTCERSGAFKFWIAGEGALFGHLDQGSELALELIEIDPRYFSYDGAVYLAIHTIEIAAFVRVEIYPKGEALRTARDHRIDKREIPKVPRVIPHSPQIANVDPLLCHDSRESAHVPMI